MVSFFPRDVLDGIWDLIGSVSEGFPTYFFKPQAEEIIAEEKAGYKGAPQNRSSTLESCVKSTSNISRICTVSSLILKKPLTEYGMQPYGAPCGITISVQI